MHYLVSFRFGLLLFLSAIHHLGITHTIRIHWTPVESKVSSKAFPTRSSKLLTPFDWLPKLIYSDNSLGLISARKSSRQMISRLTMWSGLIFLFLFFLFFFALALAKVKNFHSENTQSLGTLGKLRQLFPVPVPMPSGKVDWTWYNGSIFLSNSFPFPSEIILERD